MAAADRRASNPGKGLRLHVGLFGRRNSGKSSLLNAITQQDVSIVSSEPGTTTDPVEKPMELLPLGPVLFIDTAGIDDIGALGEMRVAKTRKAIERTDLGIIVADSREWGNFEDQLLRELSKRDIPVVAVFNKTDLAEPSQSVVSALENKVNRIVRTCAVNGTGLSDLRRALLEVMPPEFLAMPNILSDLVPPGETAVLVVPIDKEAPKGRLILPQAQAIRNLLDNGSMCVVAREHELPAALENLKKPPRLVVTDSQAFAQVSADTPPYIPLTSFSILFARLKGDLPSLVAGAKSIGRLKGGERILIAETCTHHPIEDDIGHVKIPKWLKARVGADLVFEYVRGHDFPSDVSCYALVIQCGGCMTNRREILSRIQICRECDVPVTNYGLAIAFCLGVFRRALEPFPECLNV